VVYFSTYNLYYPIDPFYTEQHLWTLPKPICY